MGLADIPPAVITWSTKSTHLIGAARYPSATPLPWRRLPSIKSLQSAACFSSLDHTINSKSISFFKFDTRCHQGATIDTWSAVNRRPLHSTPCPAEKVASGPAISPGENNQKFNFNSIKYWKSLFQTQLNKSFSQCSNTSTRAKWNTTKRNKFRRCTNHVIGRQPIKPPTMAPSPLAPLNLQGQRGPGHPPVAAPSSIKKWNKFQVDDAVFLERDGHLGSDLVLIGRVLHLRHTAAPTCCTRWPPLDFHQPPTKTAISVKMKQGNSLLTRWSIRNPTKKQGDRKSRWDTLTHTHTLGRHTKVVISTKEATHVHPRPSLNSNWLNHRPTANLRRAPSGPVWVKGRGLFDKGGH